MEKQIVQELITLIGFFLIAFGVLYLMWRLFKKIGNFRG